MRSAAMWWSRSSWLAQRYRSLVRWPRAAQHALLISVLVSLAGSLLLLLGIALA